MAAAAITRRAGSGRLTGRLCLSGSRKIGIMLRTMLAAGLATAVTACTAGKPGTTHRPYSIYADTALGFARSVRSNAPHGGRAFGLVEITFHPDYKLVAGKRGCRTDVTDVELELVVVLPKWRDGKAVPGSVKSRWARFDRTVSAHENTHIRIARDYAARMRKTIATLRSAKSCADLASLVRSRIARIKMEHLRAHARFDAGEKKRLKSLL